MSNPNLDSNSNLDPTEPAQKPMDLDTARRVEQEKLTRRAALRKLGFGAGLAAFSLLGVDDFARMVGKRMERMAGDNKVAGRIAKEFRSAGIALADSPSGQNLNCLGCCGGTDPTVCQDCCDGKTVVSSDADSPRGKCYQACVGIG